MAGAGGGGRLCRSRGDADGTPLRSRLRALAAQGDAAMRGRRPGGRPRDGQPGRRGGADSGDRRAPRRGAWEPIGMNDIALQETGADAPPRLTSLAHGGGCGCKLSPKVLREILAGMPSNALGGAGHFANLMVGTETSDDAAVWRLNDSQALVATTDFFMPVVDDPRDFGRIAATNALSDVYAMGATPILALAIVGMPVGKLPAETIRAILEGGAEVCAAAGVPVAGGHSIDSVEPIYGLVALGLVHPDKLLKNDTAKAGDLLILTKALGVGVLSAAFKQELLDGAGYEALIAS